MSEFTTIPDFTNDPASMAEALRAMKDIVEGLSGLRQGGALAAPQMFIQPNEPLPVGRLRLKNGDLWVTPATMRLQVRSANLWVEVKAAP